MGNDIICKCAPIHLYFVRWTLRSDLTAGAVRRVVAPARLLSSTLRYGGKEHVSGIVRQCIQQEGGINSITGCEAWRYMSTTRLLGDIL